MTHVQAILFDKTIYDEKKAAKWLKDHKIHPIKEVHVTENYYRYRLKVPDEDKYRYRTDDLKNGIKYIIGYLIV